jgi:predicted porin
MKKTLLAAALLAGYTGTALAQNSVTLYGRIQPAYMFESVKLSDKAADTLSAQSGTNNNFAPSQGAGPGGSNLGFKGVEDVGNGLKIGFQLEGSATIDDGGAYSFGRISTLSVANSSWGRIAVGRDYTAGSQILSGISPLGTGYGVGSAELAFGTFSVNVEEMVKYVSPSISGFTVGLTYSFGGSSVDDSNATAITPDNGYGVGNKNRLFQGGLRYANGPMVLAANYTQITPNSYKNLDAKKPKNWLIGGTYDLKMVKLHAAYGQNIDGIVSGQSALSALGGNDATNFGQIGSQAVAGGGIRTSQWMAGLSAPVGAAGKLSFSISQQRPGGDLKNLDELSTQTNFGLLYSYSLSKRTSLYANYSYADNYAMIDGVTVNQVQAGVVHLF